MDSIEQFARISELIASGAPYTRVLRRILDLVAAILKKAAVPYSMVSFEIDDEQAETLFEPQVFREGRYVFDSGSALIWRVEPARDGQIVIDSHNVSLRVMAGDSEIDTDAIAPTLQTLVNLASGVIYISVRLSEVERHASSLKDARDRLHKQNEVLRELNVVDDLTGVRNRRYFDRRLSYEFIRFRRYRRPLSLLVFDVDNFKKVNDTFGHAAGDRVLQHLCRVAEQTVRQVDLLCRYGGEEFTVLLPETRIGGGKIAGERLREAVAKEPVLVGNTPLSVTVSVGVAAVAEGYGGDSESFLRAADQALYQAKARGRNCVVVADLLTSEFEYCASLKFS